MSKPIPENAAAERRLRRLETQLSDALSRIVRLEQFARRYSQAARAAPTRSTTRTTRGLALDDAKAARFPYVLALWDAEHSTTQR